MPPPRWYYHFAISASSASAGAASSSVDRGSNLSFTILALIMLSTVSQTEVGNTSTTAGSLVAVSGSAEIFAAWIVDGADSSSEVLARAGALLLSERMLPRTESKGHLVGQPNPTSQSSLLRDRSSLPQRAESKGHLVGRIQPRHLRNWRIDTAIDHLKSDQEWCLRKNCVQSRMQEHGILMVTG